MHGRARMERAPGHSGDVPPSMFLHIASYLAEREGRMGHHQPHAAHCGTSLLPQQLALLIGCQATALC